MSSQPSLAQKIGFWSATSLIIGSIIGSGVFMKPASMAGQLGSPVWLTLVWIIGGFFSLAGALIYAELGAMMPETGGIYVYFRKMFGDFTAYLYGWAAFSVMNTAGVAAIAFVCAQYADLFLHLPRFDPATEMSIALHLPYVGDLHPLENIGVKMLAIGLVVGLTWVNSRSVKAGSVLQVISTAVKMLVMAALVFGLFIFGHGSFTHFVQAEHPLEGTALLSGVIASLTGAFFAYDGWINVTFIAGEVKNPQRNIPKSLWVGVLVCIIVYVLVNQAYLYVLPVEKVAASSLVASDAIGAAFGQVAEAVVAALIVICTFGSLNGNTLATARVTYAMGKDRLFIPWAGKEHRRYRTPGNALWLHCGWISLLILSGSFDMLADMMVFISWLAYGLGAAGVFILRKRMPTTPRPYKITGHPVVTLLFILFTAFFLVFTVYNDINNYLHHRQPVVNSLLGIIIVAIGIPFYFLFHKKRTATASSS